MSYSERGKLPQNRTKEANFTDEDKIEEQFKKRIILKTFPN